MGKMRKEKLHIKENPISISIDSVARSLYIAFSNNQVEKTIRKNNSFFIDYDKKGNIVGIEIIRLKKVEGIFKEVLKDTENKLPSSVSKTLEKYLQPA